MIWTDQQLKWFRYGDKYQKTNPIAFKYLLTILCLFCPVASLFIAGIVNVCPKIDRESEQQKWVAIFRVDYLRVSGAGFRP